jgi:hypothetical protein
MSSKDFKGYHFIKMSLPVPNNLFICIRFLLTLFTFIVFSGIINLLISFFILIRCRLASY